MISLVDVNASLVVPVVAVVALLMLAIAGPAYQLGILPLAYAFALLRWAAYVAIVAAVGNAIALVLAYRGGKRVRIALSGVAIVIAVATMAVPLRWQLAAQAAPPIHDISTDLENPPSFTAMLPLRQGAPNGLDRPPATSAAQRQFYGDIQPITLPMPREEVFEEAYELMQEREWQVIDADKDKGILEATDSTPWFGFKDDVVVRITPWGSGTRVDMRSVSRIGVSDVGTNAKRVREYLRDLKQGK